MTASNAFQLPHITTSAGPYVITQAQLDDTTRLFFNMIIMSAITGAVILGFVVYHVAGIPARRERKRVDTAIFLYRLARIREIGEETAGYYVSERKFDKNRPRSLKVVRAAFKWLEDRGLVAAATSDGARVWRATTDNGRVAGGDQLVSLRAEETR